MPLEPLFRRLDRLAGGRYAGYRVPVPPRRDRRARRALLAVLWLLLLEVAIAAVAAAVGLALLIGRGGLSVEVWLRTVVLFCMSVSLFYFLWRGWIGYYWGYTRLHLFSQVFPFVALILAAIPGLYPGWLVSEQIVYSLVLIAVADLLGSGAVRAVFPHPAPAARPVTKHPGVR